MSRTVPGPGQPRVLYIVYWGAAEPLGQSLVVPAVMRLADLGARVTLMTFDKPSDLERAAEIQGIRRALDQKGVRWVSLRYHKHPQSLAKAFDALHGCARGVAARLHGRFDIVHARTFFGGLMGMALAPLLRARLIYHNEGFYPDEQVDGGVWKLGSARHRLARRVERCLYARAHGIITLSNRACAVVESLSTVKRRRTPVIVVPSCVDLDRFHAIAEPTAAESGLRLVYIGSAGLRYLFDRVVQLAAVPAREIGGLQLRVLTRTHRRLVEDALVESGLPKESWSVDAVPHAAMPGELAQSDAGLFFLTQGLSEHGCSPTKIGEYWACGLPVVTTPNVSDTDEIVRRERVGVIVTEHSEAGYLDAISELRTLLKDPDIKTRCRRAAEAHYALEPGCQGQIALYGQVLDEPWAR